MSNIKINDVPQRIQYSATGGQTQFTIPFPFFQNSYVYVWLDGVQLFQGGAPGQYTVSGAGSPSGGLVTFNTPTILNQIVTIEGIMPIDRTSIYSATISNLTGSDLNGDFNREVVMLQQLYTTQAYLQLQYAPWALVSQDLTVTKDRYIPILEAQQVWRMNEAGDAIEAFTIDNVPAPSNSYFLTYGADPSLENEQNLALLGNGLLKQTVSGGFATLAIAIPGTDYLSPSPPLGTMAYQNASNVNITGGFAALGAGSCATTPSAGIDIANKDYVDAVAAGFTFVSPTQVATTVDLDAVYDNGVSGVGATLTANNNGAITVDGVALNMGDRILTKNQTNSFENGIYQVSVQGDGSNPFVITRATDYDSTTEAKAGTIIFVLGGATYTNSSFVETAVVTTIGVSPIVFQQFSQTFPLSMGNGGTGSSITPIANAVFSTNGSSVGQLSTTLPSGLTIPGYATSGANTDITSLTGLTGKLRAPTAIASSADINLLAFTYTASAVNYFTLVNAVTTGNPEFGVAGTDTNIGMTYRTKATGAHQFISSNTTVPMVWNTGTSAQHTTNWSVPNTSASRTITLQDLDGTMAYLADRGMVFITSGTASNSATIDLTGMTGYTNYMIFYSNFTPATNATTLAMRFSNDNGATYIATSSYRYENLAAAGAGVSAGTATGTSIAISNSHNNTAGAACGGVVHIMNPGITAYTTIFAENFYIDSTSGLRNYITGGQIVATGPMNAVRFLMSSGNISTGNWQLYGLK